MKVLIIRRDNIGDLILTTPLIATIARETGTQVDLLVNTYNKPVLDNNPHVGNVFLYSKLHHRSKGTSALSVLWQRLKTIIDLRRARYDVAIVAKERWDKRPLQWATLAGAKKIIAIGDDCPPEVTDALPESTQNEHLVKLLARLAEPLGITAEPGPLELYVRPEETEAIKQKIHLPDDGLPVYGLQISSRRPEQRWPVENFVALAQRLAAEQPCHILLFWSPGSADNKLHPGDDEKARYIIDNCQGVSLIPVVTENIRELMAGMSLCNQIVTSDGGALHIAAGVHKPIVALFGNKAAWLWTPWAVPHELLQGEGYDVRNIPVDEVYNAFIRLQEQR